VDRQDLPKRTTPAALAAGTTQEKRATSPVRARLLRDDKGGTAWKPGPQRLALVLLLVAPLLAPALLSADERRSHEREKIEDLDELSGRLNALASQSGLSEEQQFLHARVSELLGRAREAPAGSYLFDRLDSAIDDLLDASRELQRITRPDEDEEEEDRESDAQRETARDLEKTYFRVRQAEYFADQSAEPKAADYVRLVQRLYQQGRSAYDGGRYWRARRFADAARQVVEGLEGLAQAAVRIPEPPRL
jgi:hypothetical protein